MCTIHLSYQTGDRNLYGLYKCDFKKYFLPLCTKRVAGSVPRGFQNCIAFLLYVQESVHKQRIGLKGICWCTIAWKTFWSFWLLRKCFRFTITDYFVDSIKHTVLLKILSLLSVLFSTVYTVFLIEIFWNIKKKKSVKS